MRGPLLSEGALFLVPPSMQTALEYAQWMRDPDVTRFIPNPTILKPKSEARWLNQISESPATVIWGMYNNNESIGIIGLYNIDLINKSAYTGIVIGKKNMWGQGHGVVAMNLRSRYAFEKLGLEKLYSEISEDNIAARRCVAAAGYRVSDILARDIVLATLTRESWLY